MQLGHDVAFNAHGTYGCSNIRWLYDHRVIPVRVLCTDNITPCPSQLGLSTSNLLNTRSDISELSGKNLHFQVVITVWMFCSSITNASYWWVILFIFKSDHCHVVLRRLEKPLKRPLTQKSRTNLLILDKLQDCSSLQQNDQCSMFCYLGKNMQEMMVQAWF